ncbi:MAG: hypothetical protein HQ557_01210 [Bacteroidetes bacterium]|nr:hypothetical protein [Bacteroidota bacterium]
MAGKSKTINRLFPGWKFQSKREFTTTVLGIFVEIVLANAAIMLLFFFIPNIQNSFLTMNLHPLFILTAIIGIRHGYLPGLTTALIASAAYIVGYLYKGLDLVLFFKVFDFYKFPIMFLIAGYTTGRVRDTYSRNVRTMKTANTEILEEYNKLEEDYRRTILMYNELKEQIVGSEYSIFSLYEIAASLQTTNPEKVYTEAIGILHKFIKATTIAIYTLESGGYLRLKLIYGEYGRKRSSIRFVDEPKYMKLVESKKPVRWTKAENEDFPLFSAPIMEDDTVIGLINIDAIEFEHITEYSFSVFCVIAEWINKALSQAIDIDRTYNVTGVSWSNLLKKNQFDMQLEEEEIRLQKYGLPYCYGKFKVLTTDIEMVVFSMRKVLRSVDFVCYDEQRDMLEILLPATGKGNYTLVSERIKSTLTDTVEEIE